MICKKKIYISTFDNNDDIGCREFSLLALQKHTFFSFMWKIKLFLIYFLFFLWFSFYIFFFLFSFSISILFTQNDHIIQIRVDMTHTLFFCIFSFILHKISNRNKKFRFSFAFFFYFFFFCYNILRSITITFLFINKHAHNFQKYII